MIIASTLRRLAILASLTACDADHDRRVIDATPPAFDTAADAQGIACTSQRADMLVASYCAGGFQGSGGTSCVSNPGTCQSEGAQARGIAEAAGCLCYYCQLYQFAVDNMVCVTPGLNPAFLLDQCLNGTLRCP